MREIKFRAWDTEKKRMIEHNSQELVLIPCLDNYGADAHFKYEKWGDINISHFDWASADLIGQRYIPMQYIGLKDKNGTEIYIGDLIKECVVGQVIWDGDIVQECPYGEVVDKPPHIGVHQIKKGLVKLKKGGISQVNLTTYDGLYQWPDGIEIIGNIHQNPELVR